ncbi:threonylcarbamoyl-AMP synthase [Vulcanibacillus modesticaldus]|uniref:Threonylcarbamoyl-AMP synthase n=1 Tax=Vulcanibacillus modesticaldus TaxID=337097 RepID=A0A1D2YVX4_9BACI|nr:L-threonylcarbamoyladenylate synthase [Vulcanibacillus modesticaldus]OEF99888.1 threonylcarbamoyl-AMP synthase [Vulcanibacillus modesticaldus]
MTTMFWKLPHQVDIKHPDIVEIAKRLRQGEIIAFPTETVYGLGANALDAKAVAKIFVAKGRPSDNPLIVHIATMEQLALLVEEIDENSRKLIEHFWPGPLTIIFKKKEMVSELVTAGLNTVAVRMPNHPIALTIIEAANLPIAAPSANRSGKPSPTTAEHVFNDLNGKIDGIVDGGPTGVGVESTVIDLTGDVPMVLRPGGVTIEELQEVLGEVKLDPAIVGQKEQPRSPGMKYRHYAPTGEMWIVKGDDREIIKKINSLIKEKSLIGKKVGILTTNDHRESFQEADLILAYGTKDNLYPLAEHLYEALRIFDLNGIDYILAEAVEEKGIGLAIMNRLKKAAGEKFIQI